MVLVLDWFRLHQQNFLYLCVVWFGCSIFLIILIKYIGITCIICKVRSLIVFFWSFLLNSVNVLQTTSINAYVYVLVIGHCVLDGIQFQK